MKSRATAPNAKTSPKRKRGRPHIKIDVELLRQLANIQCTLPEMAAALRCSTDTLQRNFAPIIDEGRENGKKSLRRLQFEHAKKYWGMALFLGKIYLNQKEAINDATQYSKIIVERSAPERPNDHAGRVLDADKSSDPLAK
jgi:hypothetical protein